MWSKVRAIMSHFDSRLQRLGVPEMDADHRELVEIADRIDDLVSTKHFIDIDLTLLINEFIRHSIEHFEREEAYMDSINFPGVENHKHQHKSLIAGLRKIFGAVSADEFVATSLRSFMSMWLFEHINKHDTQYAAYASDLENGLVLKAA
jgi:hemerythrin